MLCGIAGTSKLPRSSSWPLSNTCCCCCLLVVVVLLLLLLLLLSLL
jgi:hypothetical protein